MSLRSRARFFLPKNPFVGLSLTSAWVRKIQETRIEARRVPIRSLSPEDRERRLRYWRRTERQNRVIGLIVFGFLIADMLVFHDVLATIGTVGAVIFVSAHWYYAHRMVQLLSENTPAGRRPVGGNPAGCNPAGCKPAGCKPLPAKDTVTS